MDIFENFIPTQCIINNTLIESVSKLAESTKTISKAIRKTNRLSISCFIFSAAAVGAMIAESKIERAETNRKISRLEEKIKELEEGE